MHLHQSILPLQPGDKTTLITTMSGLVGGMYRTLSLDPLLLNVTWDGTITVIAYAVISASAGYITKFVFDAIKKRFQ